MPSGVASLALLFWVVSNAAAQDIAAPNGVIHYSVEPMSGINGVNALRVKVRFVGNSQGQSIFELPSDAIGGHERWTYLSDFQGRGVRIIANEKKKRTFLYRPGATVTVTYRV